MFREVLQDAGELVLSPAPLLSDSFRQREVLQETAHRPWPLPEGPWFMGQVWSDLLFAHWRVPREALERVVPAPLLLDEFDDSVWLGITPFQVRGLRLRGTVPVQPISSFAEINVRTYVSFDSVPGIYFLSLDAASVAAVHAARLGYRLPYFHSRMSIERDGDGVLFEAARDSEDGPGAVFRARYGPTHGEAVSSGPDSLERWLTERYCLYTMDESHRIHRGEIHHPPWPLRNAWADIEANTMALPQGIELSGDPLLHFSARQDVALWPLRPAI
jgi:uncharacterized protein YqjF (DUF2071 family)